MAELKVKAFLEGLYYVYARRELVYPDPLFFVYDYVDVKDREIAALIASSLAYGRVAQIMKSVERVLSCLGSHPHKLLLDNKNFDIVPDSFKHRFTTSYDINNLLSNITRIIRDFGSLEAFMSDCMRIANSDFPKALDMFSAGLSKGRHEGAFPLVCAPKDGSACKRLMLCLRWLVRDRDVDPGGWTVLTPAKLLVPVDVHMQRLALILGLTVRRVVDWAGAVAITRSLARCDTLDPVKFDFPLTRFGIRSLSEDYIIQNSPQLSPGGQEGIL